MCTGQQRNRMLKFHHILFTITGAIIDAMSMASISFSHGLYDQPKGSTVTYCYHAIDKQKSVAQCSFEELNSQVACNPHILITASNVEPNLHARNMHTRGIQ